MPAPDENHPAVQGFSPDYVKTLHANSAKPAVNQYIHRASRCSAGIKRLIMLNHKGGLCEKTRYFF